MSTNANINHLELRYNKNKSMIDRKMDNTTILVPIRKRVGDLSNVYYLNETASRVWELIAENLCVQDIVAVITDEYDTATEIAHQDVKETIERLEEIGAIVPK